MALANIENKVYIFLDWANTYRKGRALHWEKFCPYFERYEGCVSVKDINELSESEKKYYKDELEQIEKHNKKKVYLSTYFIQAEYLKSVCSRSGLNGDEPPKERCFAFVSHPPGVSIEHNRAVKILNQCFTIKYHERVELANNREKEKGVDVALAVQIMATIYEEEDNTNLRIVIVSGDTDFAPVVKKIMQPEQTEKIAKKNISVEVWGWKSNMSKSYVDYLEELEKICKKKILYYLDEYMYQISYVQNLEHRWCISMAPAKDAHEFICKWFERLSHYTLAKDIMNSTTFGLQTTHFTIRRKCNRIIISFLTEKDKEQFKHFYQEFRANYFYDKLNHKEYDVRQWIQKQNTALHTNKINNLKPEGDNAVNTEDDEEIVFQE